MPRLVLAALRRPVAAAILGGFIFSPNTSLAQNKGAGSGDGGRNAAPMAATRGERWYNRAYKPNTAAKPNATMSNAKERSANPVAKRNGSPSDADRVLSPFAPPPVPRAATTRSRSSVGSIQVDRNQRRLMGTPRTNARQSSKPYQNTSQYDKSLFDKSQQAGPYSRADISTPPRILLPANPAPVNRDQHIDNGGAPNRSPGPRELQYDPHNPQRNSHNAQSDPRRFEPDAQPLPAARRPQAQDDQTAREQLRAIQQERINRETAKWKSEQAKLKATAPTPRAAAQQSPADRSDSSSADPGDGPLLLAPSQ